MLQFRAVSKQYAGQMALHDMDLQVPAGRTVVLIGPSGCGKSTVLRLVAGLIRPDHGHMEFSGHTLTPENIVSLRRRMGYVIQEGGLFPHLSARDNVILLARYLRWPAARIDARLAELAELVQLPASLLARHPGALSGGQRQRVALMRALLPDPDLLLLDEPLGALDPMVRHELQNDLKALFARLGKTTLMVTHDMSEAAWFADEIVLMKDGRVVQTGTAAELVQHPAEAFVGDFIRAQRRPFAEGPVA